MLFMASNLTRRGEVYYFRARVPTHLVTAYGREIVSLSLRTTDLRVAKERAREHAVALDRALRAIEQEARPDADFAGTVLHLSDEDIEGLCLRYRSKVLAADARLE